MKIYELEHNLTTFTHVLEVVSTLVKYPGVEKLILLYFRRFLMNKIEKHINHFISAAEMKILNMAARILINSDKHDEYFFTTCQTMVAQSQSASKSATVHLGERYALVCKARPAMVKTADIQEYAGGND